VLTLPAIDGLSAVYFLRLTLENEAGKMLASNFYWLSTQPETLDWEHATWHFTPTVSYADFTALNQLPKVRLALSDRTERHGEQQVTHVLVENRSPSLAFFVRFKVNDCVNGEEILPAVWQDNYFSLLPGEKRDVTATYRLHDDLPVSVELGGWNVAQFRSRCGK
jgi:exo-1,4-beta-D-glucosaminidase